MNIARDAWLHAGLPTWTPSTTIDRPAVDTWRPVRGAIEGGFCHWIAHPGVEIWGGVRMGQA